jgi:Putative transposase/Transposase zinc-binding domain
MTSVAAALRRHAPAYLAGLADTHANIPIRKAFAAIMRCRTGQLGGVQWQCDGCGRSHWVGRSCGNRHCSTCGSEKTNDWLEKQSSKLLVGVHHLMVTFTVPQELREVLRVYRRSGYEALFAASSAALSDVAGRTKSLRGSQLGFFGVLHTWGRDPLVYHPHIHYLVPGGGVVVDSAGKPVSWKPTPRNFLVHHATLITVFKAKLADEMRERGLYAMVPAIAWTKKFVVDIEPVEDGRSVVAYLAPYVHRVAISDHRIKAVTDDSVTYTYKPTKSPTLRSRTVTGQQFVAGFAQHVLPTGFHKVRYFGWMTSNSKTKLEEIRIIVWMAIGWIYWLSSGHSRQPEPIKRPTVRCAACGRAMRIMRIINKPIPLLLLEHGLAYLDSS